MSKETSRRGLFGALRKAVTSEESHPSLRHPQGKPFLGIRDIKPRGSTDVPDMAMPAETALSAEMTRLGETPPPWIPGSEGER